MTALVTPLTAQDLSCLFDAAVSDPDDIRRNATRNAIADCLERLISRYLRLPASALSYRQDCVQELTIGLYQLLERWHQNRRLSEIQSLQAFVRQYVRWHVSPVVSRVVFRLPSSRGLVPPVYESELDDAARFSERTLQRTSSGIYLNVETADRESQISGLLLSGFDIGDLSEAEQRIIQLLDAGETSRRRIELTLVAEFGLSHRQARRMLTNLANRCAD